VEKFVPQFDAGALYVCVYFPLDRAFDCIGAALNFINMRSLYLKKPLRGTMKISRREITKRLRL
jgi:hypothetical protein